MVGGHDGLVDWLELKTKCQVFWVGVMEHDLLFLQIFSFCLHFDNRTFIFCGKKQLWEESSCSNDNSDTRGLMAWTSNAGRIECNPGLPCNFTFLFGSSWNCHPERMKSSHCVRIQVSGFDQSVSPVKEKRSQKDPTLFRLSSKSAVLLLLSSCSLLSCFLLWNGESTNCLLEAIE